MAARARRPARSADAGLCRQFTFRWKFVAGTALTILDQLADKGDNCVGSHLLLPATRADLMNRCVWFAVIQHLVLPLVPILSMQQQSRKLFKPQKLSIIVLIGSIEIFE